MNYPLGWITFDDRTPQMHQAHEMAVGAMPRFFVSGPTVNDDVKKVVLTDLWTHPTVVQALGYSFPRVHQLTGSCVGAGGGNAVFTLSAIEVVRLGDPEQILVPFWLLPYGKSRQRAGMRGRGEGSLGSTFAEAIQKDGIIPANLSGLPSFRNDDGLVWSQQNEMAWSDGSAIEEHWMSEARKHLVQTVAPCRSADEVREAIRNGYPCTDACGGFVGNPRRHGDVLLGEIDNNGGHQTSIQGWWEHPELGELFLYVNQWPKSVYPDNPGCPDCSTWITKQTMNQICRDEVYAFSQFQGFPAQVLSWLI